MNNGERITRSGFIGEAVVTAGGLLVLASSEIDSRLKRHEGNLLDLALSGQIDQKEANLSLDRKVAEGFSAAGFTLGSMLVAGGLLFSAGEEVASRLPVSEDEVDSERVSHKAFSRRKFLKRTAQFVGLGTVLVAGENALQAINLQSEVEEKKIDLRCGEDREKCIEVEIVSCSGTAPVCGVHTEYVQKTPTAVIVEDKIPADSTEKV